MNWFDDYAEALPRYQQTAASKKAIDKAPGKGFLPTIPLSCLCGVPALRPLARASFPQFPSPAFAECQPRFAKNIVRGSRYNAAILYGIHCICFYLSDFAPPRMRSTSSSSTDMQLNLQKRTAVYFEEHFSTNPCVSTQRVFFGLCRSLLDKVSSCWCASC